MQINPLTIYTLVVFLSPKPTRSQQNFLTNLIAASREFLNLPGDLVNDTTRFEKSYDFIIVGGGSAGCALANRLSEVPQWKILLLEAGKDEILMTDIPLASTYWTYTNFNWGYKTVPQNDSCLAMYDQKCTWPRGKVMGGTSTINFLVYTRGHPKDYDEWERLGNPGWGWRDVFPYFKKLERVEIPELRNSPYRGRKGYVNINHSPWRTPLAKSFLDAGRELGFDINDPNGEQMIGFSYIQATMKNGRRVSSSKAYIRPIRRRKNLHVAKEARVTKILIDPMTNTTYGVEFVKRRRTYRVKATKEVLLSAGTLNSPQLLMLSGIGPAEHLTKLRIPVVKNLPVGENLQDHVSFGSLVFLINDTISLVEDRIAMNPLNSFDYALRNTGPMTSPGGAEGVAFVNTQAINEVHPKPRDSDVPDIEIVMGAGGLTGDTGGALRRSFGIRDDIYYSMYGDVVGRDGFSMVPILMKPKSRGRVRLKSKNPFHWPLLYPNYYKREEDIETMIRGIKMSIRIAETKSYARFNAQLHTGQFPNCSHLPFRTDPYWACALRQSTTNLHHQVGTCKMGPKKDPTAVVDPELKVHGIRGLRVVDCSIMPTIPASHTNSVAMMIAEKAADLIKSTWLKREAAIRLHRAQWVLVESEESKWDDPTTFNFCNHIQAIYLLGDLGQEKIKHR